MLKKQEIIDVCKSVAGKFPGWEFSSGCFKNKELPFCTKLIEPLWSFSPGSALAQPIVGIYHKEICTLHKKLFNSSADWISRVSFEDVYQEYKWSALRFNDLIGDKVEERVTKIVGDGDALLSRYYDFSTEHALLESIPKDIEGQNGARYCLVRAYLGDFDFVRRYRRDEIETTIPKLYSRIDKVMEYFNISH